MKNDWFAVICAFFAIVLEEEIAAGKRILLDEKEVLAGAEADDDPDIDNQ